MEIQNPFQVVWEKNSCTNFADFVFGKIAKFGSQPALIDHESGKQWRFSEIKQFSETCACRLREMGVNPNSRVATITGTTCQALFVHLGCAIIGSVSVCINGHGPIDELWQQVDLSESTHCVTEGQFLSKVEEVRRKAVMRGGGRIKVIKTLEDVLGNTKIETTAPLIKRESKAQLLKEKEESQGSGVNSTVTTPTLEEALDCETLSEEPLDNGENLLDKTAVAKSPLFIFYSSGTTGLPKAVEVTHQSLIVNMIQISLPLYNVLSQKDRFLLPICLHHIFGTLSAYYALINGATVIMQTKSGLRNFLQILEEHKITQTHITPPIVQFLAADAAVPNHNLSHLRSVIVSGAPLDPNVAHQCRDRLQLKDLRQVYGMTELSGICTFSYFQSTNVESVGVPLPGMLLRIVHWETKQLCQPRQMGQILVSGPQVMPNFYRNPKATAEILDAGKMVRTGDAGYYDEKGFIYVVGRIKDMIKYKGTLVCPSEVESVMRTHPGIDDCAVVGRQDHVSGEVPAAFVVRNPNYQLLASAEVRQHVAGKIAQFKELRGGVYFISEIPRTVCGKVIRRQLKQHWDRERTVAKSEAVAAVSGGIAGANTPSSVGTVNGTTSGKSRRASSNVQPNSAATGKPTLAASRPGRVRK